MWILWLGLAIVSLWGFFKLLGTYQKHTHQKFWKKLGIKPDGVSASLLERILGFKDFLEVEMDFYLKLKREGRDFVGVTDMNTRILYIRSPELVKAITVKDADIWMNRRDLHTDDDPVIGKMLVFMNGKPWKELRNVMTPNFSTGKIRKMFQGIEVTSNQFVKSLREKVVQGGGRTEVEFRDASGSFTMDAIFSTFFGLDAGTIKNRDNPLAKMGLKFQEQNFSAIIQTLLFVSVPSFAKMLGIRFLSNDALNFFNNTVKRSVAERERSGERRDDFIQLMIDHKKNGVEKLTLMEFDDQVIASTAIMLLLAGFDTVETLISVVVYHLATDPDLQEEMYAEVSEAIERGGGKLSYESINSELDFMDRFISEALRLYPGIIRNERMNVEDYIIPGTTVKIPKGTLANFPVYALMRDPDVFPDPDRFDPSRFLQSEKDKRDPYHFLPFGHGSRACIGNRFALVETKAVISALVANFKMEPSAKLEIPMQLTMQAGGLFKPKGGIFVKLTTRGQEEVNVF